MRSIPPVETICKGCGKPFHHKRCVKRVYCSRSCHISVNNKKREWDEKSKNKISFANKGRLSGSINPNWSGGGVQKKCKNCGGVFNVSINELKARKRNGTYCSTQCRKLWLAENRIPDHQRKLHSLMRGNVTRCIKEKKAWRKWTELVGYTAKELADHLESKFTEGMTWDKYPLWHIDHIIPVSAFRFNSFSDLQFKECWALKNLQPLWAIDNIRKGGTNRDDRGN